MGKFACELVVLRVSLKRRVLEALESAVRLIVNDNESDDDSLKSSGSFDEYFVSLLQVA